MRKIFLALVGILTFFRPAMADVLLVQTNDWNVSKKVMWTCALDGIDGRTGIARFWYAIGDGRKYFSVHISRILSLTIDHSNREPRDFPPTRQNLESALPSDLEQNRTIELTNNELSLASLPESIFVVNRDNPILYLYGSVNSINARSLTVTVLNKSRHNQSLELDRGIFRAWIR